MRNSQSFVRSSVRRGRVRARARVRSRSVAISFVAVALDRSVGVGAPSSGTGVARGARARGTNFASVVVGRSTVDGRRSTSSGTRGREEGE